MARLNQGVLGAEEGLDYLGGFGNSTDQYQNGYQTYHHDTDSDAVGRARFDVTPRRPPTSEGRFGSSALDLLRRPRHLRGLRPRCERLSPFRHIIIRSAEALPLGDRHPPQRHDTERRPGGPRHTPESAPTRGARGPINRRYQRGGDTIAITQRGNT